MRKAFGISSKRVEPTGFPRFTEAAVAGKQEQSGIRLSLGRVHWPHGSSRLRCRAKLTGASDLRVG